MGQYYMASLVDEKSNIKTLNPHEYDNGMKLMEHSYIGNNYMAAVMNEMNETPYRVYWLGDYADIKDFKNKTHKLYAKDRKKIWEEDRYRVHPEGNWNWGEISYLINIDDKLYIKLKKYNPNAWNVHPLSLLTAIGNGKGGGDYFAELNNDKVGEWAGKKLMITKNHPNKKYTEVFFKFKKD